MVSFEEAGLLLDKAVEELPEEIFKDLNGGVNLICREKHSDDGRYVMGLYHHDSMGRYIEIFYGSFAALYANASPEEFEKELKKTLHHELTHHIESKAGDRTLERWDEEQTALWAQGVPLETDSVLFVCLGRVLSPAADALFRGMAEKRRLDVSSAYAAMEASAPPPLPEAVKAAQSVGADISSAAPQAVSEELLSRFGAVLCMTLDQADTLAGRYPKFDSKIMCLGQRDINPPRMKNGWAKTMRLLKAEIESLVDELCTGDE